ncbi:ROK family transcriptional regulator [Motilibacter aurantiacus]|uniref:ROK family transcriptional regulator n=1 Tax=Motilibacter aurantiacus TaxID=2714955 RepID=UPI00140C1537|nr:ROK family transcriptional regulator [Motilibacter aurantiacus]NHC44503.1 ROK family transcriptional regulator [Motilibacter aurantiacus]
MPTDSATRGQQALRSANRALLLSVLREGPASRAALARATRLSSTTVSSLVAELAGAGVVEVGDGAAGTGAGRTGRPGRLVRLAPDRGVVMGLDLSYDGVRGAVGDLDHRVLAEAERLFPRLPEADEEDLGPLGGLVAEVVAEAVAAAGVPVERLARVVVGVPGVVDPLTASAVSTRAPWWSGVTVSKVIGEALGRELPVSVENDADLLTVGEAQHGAARGMGDVLGLDASSGVGLGLLLDGRLHRGFRGGAGEIGHVQVVEGGGFCVCGNRGCLETVASLDHVLGELRPVHGERAGTREDLERLVSSGDRAAVRAVSDAGALIGKVVADACTLLAPQAVVVSGSLAAGGPVLCEAVRTAVARHTTPRSGHPVQVLQNSLGDRAVVLGALALAAEDATTS